MSSSLNFHTQRKQSPRFLLGAPENLSTTPCTNSAISFTKDIICSSSTSVVYTKCLIAQNPNMATTLWPGIIGSTSPVCPILSEIILTPASPNPRATSAPTFTIVYSSNVVSSVLVPTLRPFSTLSSVFIKYLNMFHQLFFPLSFLLRRYFVSASLSSLEAASIGFFAILYIFSIILRIGPIMT